MHAEIDEHEPVVVAVPPLPLRLRRQFEERRLPAGLAEPAHARITQQRFGQVRDVRHPDAAVVGVGPVPAEGAVQLAEHRGVADAGDLLALVLQPDEGGPDRDVADERPGAVDRVDDPPKPGAARLVAELLAEEAVGGEVLRDERTDEFLGALVGDGDGAGVGLQFDLEGGLVVGAGEVAGPPGRLHGQLVAGAPVGIHPVLRSFRQATSAARGRVRALA